MKNVGNGGVASASPLPGRIYIFTTDPDQALLKLAALFESG